MLNQIAGLIIDTAATVFAAVFLLRFWAQAVGVRPPEQAAGFIFKLSNWLVLPLRQVVPPLGGYDWPCLIGTALAAVFAVLPVVWMTEHFNAWFVMLASTQQVLNWIFYGFMALIALEAIFSWVNPDAPLAPFVGALNEPLLRPLRSLIPPLGGIDLSMLVALILLRVVLQLLSSLLVSLI